MALPKDRTVVHRALRIALFLLLAILGAGTLATIGGPRAYRWHAFTIVLGVRPALSGQSRLEVPPLGEVHAHTHQAPLTLYARLDAVSIDDLKRLALSSTPRATLERDLKGFAERSVKDFALRLIAWGAAGALLAPLLFRSRRARMWLVAPVVGAASIGLLLFLTQATFRADAFRKQPTFTGSLEQAPWAIALVQNAVSNTEALGTRLRNVSVNLRALYGRIGDAAADPAGDTGAVRILHISDIHNNPAAISFVRDLATKFEVAAVIDTGDLSDFGTPVEAQGVQGLAGLKDLGVPYIFVAGNHDSEATMRAVETAFGGTVLRAGDPPVTVAGLRVIGSPDPSSLREGTGSVDTSPEALKEAGEALLQQYQKTTPPPDIVCVHNPKQATPLQGTASLVLCGHLHTPSITDEKGTVICNAGTTGAAGGRYFERPEGVPFSAAILHFSPAKPTSTGAAARPRLLFIDQVLLQGSLREYSITRRGFGGPSASPAPTPGETAPDRQPR
ncbi:MAG: metallophosphoesterase [Armatimonas sp.]